MTDAIEEYQRVYQHYVEATRALGIAVESYITDSLIDVHVVKSRTKSIDSASGKFNRLRGNRHKYDDPIRQVTDLIGIRVITYLNTDIDLVAEKLRSKFKVHEHEDRTARTMESGNFGYAGTHLILSAEGDRIPDGCRKYAGMRFEVQVRTVLQHAWAEIEHDIRFKSSNSTTSPEIDRAFTLAAGLIELADEQFRIVDALHRDQQQTDAAQPESQATLTMDQVVSVLSVELSSYKPSRIAQYEWLTGLLATCGIHTPEDLEGLIDHSRIKLISNAIRYQYPPGQVRLVDDLLLDRLRSDYIERTGQMASDPDRESKLSYRLVKLMQFASTQPKSPDNELATTVSREQDG